jgi:hypothetical protein
MDTEKDVLTQAPTDCWLALNDDETRVVGHGKTPEAAVKEAQANGVDDPLLLWAPKDWIPQVL